MESLTLNAKVQIGPQSQAPITKWFEVWNLPARRPGRQSLGVGGSLGEGWGFGRSRRAGFTLVEVVILLALFILVASIVLASFPRLSQRINLQHSSQGLALALRRAQNMAFAVRQVQTPLGRRIPPAYGLYFNRASPTSVILFADLLGADGTSDGLYRGGDDVIVETVKLDPGIQINELISDIGGGNQRQDVLNISFSVPEARMVIANASFSVGESAEISLKSGSLSYVRSVTVRTSGQVSTR